MRISRLFLVGIIGISALGLPQVTAAPSHTLTKLLDMPASPGSGPAKPYDTPLLVGNDLWFTSESGGTTGFGALASYSIPGASLTTRFGTMDNTTGITPLSSFTQDGNLLYYTTSRRGTGDRGTLNAWNISTSTNTVLWNSPSNSPATNPNSLAGNVAVVDRGPSKDIYFMTGNGGPDGAGIGTIQRYNTGTGTSVTAHNFTAAPGSRQPFEGFTRVGSDLYFTTFSGGNTGTGFPFGAGTLNKLNVSASGSEVFTQLAVLPAGDGSTRFPAHNPTYDSAANALYLTTAGTTTQPGSVQKYDLTSNTLTTLFELQPSIAPNNFPDGRLAYGSIAQVGDGLYYTTITGGANFGTLNPAPGAGTVNRFDLTTNTNEVLFSLGNDGLTNWGNEARGGFAQRDLGGGQYELYFLARGGGANNNGTLLRLDVIPEPSTIMLLALGLGVGLYKLRRSRR